MILFPSHEYITLQDDDLNNEKTSRQGIPSDAMKLQVVRPGRTFLAPPPLLLSPTLFSLPVSPAIFTSHSHSLSPSHTRTPLPWGAGARR